jgi:beta-N-acetylhexosaminidase
MERLGLKSWPSRRHLARFALLLAAVVAGLVLLVPRFTPDAEPGEELRRQIGQILMVGFHGSAIHESGPAILREQIERGEVGGVLYLGRNVAGIAELQAMNRAFRKAGGKLPPLIAVDQEGGRIARLKADIGFPETPSARWFGIHADPAVARERYGKLASGLKKLLFNTNLGPVVDLDLDPRNPIISRLERSYSQHPDEVASFAAAFVEAHREAAVVTSLKHFPGHGSTLLDSHRGLPDISGSWSPRELEPYNRLFSMDLADMVMVGHLALGLEAHEQDLPATLSPVLVTGLLRTKLGFDGVIISDDMDMGAITRNYSLENAVIRAIRAGTDIVIVSNFQRNDPFLAPKLIRTLGREAMRDAEFRASIERSYARIVSLKHRRLGGDGPDTRHGAKPGALDGARTAVKMAR